MDHRIPILLISLIIVMGSASGKIGTFWEGRPIFQTEQLPYFVRVTTPKDPGHYTPIVFSTGFASVIPPSFYTDFVARLAKKGFIVMSLFAIQIPNYSKMAEETGTTFTWLKANIQEKLQSNGYSGVNVNWDEFVMLSHSASGHVYCSRLVETCADNPKLLILLDPVDGYDPFGIIHDNVVPDPPATLSFRMPTLIIATHLSDTGSVITPPCTDPKLSNLHFYNGLAAPTYFVRFQEYGHADLLNSPLSKLAPVCGGCSNCVFKLNDYHEATAILIETFVKGMFEKNAEELQKIQNPETLIPGFKLFYEHDLHGFDPLKGGYCYEQATELIEQ